MTVFIIIKNGKILLLTLCFSQARKCVNFSYANKTHPPIFLSWLFCLSFFPIPQVLLTLPAPKCTKRKYYFIRQACWIITLIGLSSLKYDSGEPFPIWVTYFGRIIALLSLIHFPVATIKGVLSLPGPFLKVSKERHYKQKHNSTQQRIKKQLKLDHDFRSKAWVIKPIVRRQIRNIELIGDKTWDGVWISGDQLK